MFISNYAEKNLAKILESHSPEVYWAVEELFIDIDCFFVEALKIKVQTLFNEHWTVFNVHSSNFILWGKLGIKICSKEFA